MRLDKRLAKVAKVLAARGPVDQFHIIEAIPVGRDRAEGREPGLYRAGPEGSLAGVLVYDPAKGAPVVPEGRLAPWGVLVVCNYDTIEPPVDWPPEEQATAAGKS
jgi:hypothetical protein